MENRTFMIKEYFSTAKYNTTCREQDLGPRSINLGDFERIEAWGGEDMLEQNGYGEGKR